MEDKTTITNIPYNFRITIENLTVPDEEPDVMEVSSALLFVSQGQDLTNIEMHSSMIGSAMLLMYLCMGLPGMVGHVIQELQQTISLYGKSKKAD